MSKESFKEKAKWNKIGGITLLLFLLITELIIWFNVFEIQEDGKLGASAIAFAVFAGMGVPMLFRSRMFNHMAKQSGEQS